MATVCLNNMLYTVPDTVAIWNDWNTLNTTSVTSSATTWNSWINLTATTTTTSSATANTVWINWISNGIDIQLQAVQNQAQAANQYTQAANQYSNPMMNPYAAPQGQEALERQRQAVEQHRQQAAEANAKLQAAQKRAMELLRENLSKKQREALDKHGWFLVEGGKSKKTYRIHGGSCAGNIIELCKNHKKEIARYCVHASYEIPLGDQLLSQMISLRLDEDHIIGRANRTAIAA